MAQHYPNLDAADHVEARTDDWSSRACVSGHLRYTDVVGIWQTASYMSSFLVREPVAQTLSHISQLRRLARDEKSLAARPDSIRYVATRLDALTSPDPADIRKTVDFILNEPIAGLLRDGQSRYFLTAEEETYATDAEKLDLSLERALSCDVIGETEKLSAWAKQVAQVSGWSTHFAVPHLNVAPEHFGVDLRDAGIRQMLSALVPVDLKFHEVLTGRNPVELGRQ